MNEKSVHFRSTSNRKSRGAFFTPPAVSAFLAEWAIRSGTDRVLEPSCGESSFLIAAEARLERLRSEIPLLAAVNCSPQLIGFEIHDETAQIARRALAQARSQFFIREEDFLEVSPTDEFDAILGNPPFVRYQSFAGDAREKGLRAALAAGVNLSGLSSSWAPFLIHSSRFLKPTGRLGMVLPAELLSVHYAGPVRRFLLSRFSSLRIVVFEKLIFKDALENVVLLMAEGEGGCDRIEVMQVRDAESLPPGKPTFVQTKTLRDDRWVATLVKPDAWDAFISLGEGPLCEPLSNWGSPYLGAVTGDNNYFCLSDEQAARLELCQRDLVRVSPPGTRHLRGLEFGSKFWEQLRKDGRRCWLFYPSVDSSLSNAAARYIAAGEAHSVHMGYKCRTRKPWWRVPLVELPDLFLTYMDQERPRLVTNSCQSYHLNSLYGIRLKRGRKKIGSRLLPLAALNTVSLLGAEIHGRSYGGGLLKLEPREADRIPLPSLRHIIHCARLLDAVRPPIVYALERSNLSVAVSIVDNVLWSKHSESRRVLTLIRQAREQLFHRRNTRSRGSDNA